MTQRAGVTDSFIYTAVKSPPQQKLLSVFCFCFLINSYIYRQTCERTVGDRAETFVAAGAPSVEIPGCEGTGRLLKWGWFKGLVQHFRKYAFWLSGEGSDNKIDATLYLFSSSSGMGEIFGNCSISVGLSFGSSAVSGCSRIQSIFSH